MKRTNIYTVAIAIFVVIIIAAAGYAFYQRTSTSADSYVNTTYGVSFNYPKEYKLEEKNLPDNEGTVVTLTKKGFVLPKNGEGSTAMTISMYPNAPAPKGGKSSADIWIATASSSNFSLSTMKSPGTTRVADRDARLYTWDGLYPATTVVTDNGGNIIMFTVTYDGAGDMEMLQDFTDLMESVILEEPGYATSSEQG